MVASVPLPVNTPNRRSSSRSFKLLGMGYNSLSTASSPQKHPLPPPSDVFPPLGKRFQLVWGVEIPLHLGVLERPSCCPPDTTLGKLPSDLRGKQIHPNVVINRSCNSRCHAFAPPKPIRFQEVIYIFSAFIPVIFQNDARDLLKKVTSAV